MGIGKSKNPVSSMAFIKSIFKFSISSWVNFLISTFSVIITTRIFSPEVYGNITMFNTVSSLFMGFVCLGLDSSFMRFYNEPPKNFDAKQLLARCMGIPILLLIGIMMLIIPFFYKDISYLFFNRISFLVVILLCINTFSLIVLNYFSVCYRISNNAKMYTIQSILVQFFTKVFVIAAALFNPSFEIVITFNTIGIFALAIIYYFIQRSDVLPEKIDWSMKGFSEVFKYALYSWPIIILIYYNAFFSQIIVSKKLGIYELGIYASTGFFVGALGVLQNGFKTYWAAFMYSNYKTEQSTISKVHDYVVLFVVFILGMFIIFQNVLYQLLGTQYQESRYFFTLIMIYPLFSLISETTSYGITIEKKTQYSLIINILSTILNLLFSIILIRYYGLIGVALASVLSSVVQTGVSSFVGQKYYKTISNPKRTLVAGFLVILLASLNCIFADNYIIMLFITISVYGIATIIYNTEITEIIKFGVDVINRYKKSK